MRLLLVCGSLCLAACSSPGGPPAGGGGGGSVSGTLLGKPFTATDALCNDCGGGVNYVTLSNGGGSFCGGTAVGANADFVLFNFGTAAPGRTYTGAVVDFVALDTACNQVAHASGDGTVTITAANASAVSGHFSATLDGAPSAATSLLRCATPLKLASSGIRIIRPDLHALFEEPRRRARGVEGVGQAPPPGCDGLVVWDVGRAARARA
jgi:hypothetical protein